MIRQVTLVTATLFYSMLALGQEQEPSSIIAADSTWGSEYFEFPLRFAQEIDFKGTEEAIFPAGWGDTKSPQFWTYAFAWKINHDQALSTSDFEINLQYYFDGLLGLNMTRTNEDQLPRTNAIFIKNDTSNYNMRYVGKIKTFDTRFTQEPMILHVRAEQHYCQKTQNAVILFKFSPKAFTNDVWLKFDKVKLPDDICNK